MLCWDSIEWQFLLEIVGEGGVTVCHNRLRDTMEFKDIIHEYLSYYKGLEGVL